MYPTSRHPTSRHPMPLHPMSRRRLTSRRNIVALLLSVSLSMPSVMMSAAYGANTAYRTYVIATFAGAELLPSVQQQLNSTPGGGSVSVYQDKLVLRTTPAGYHAVNLLLNQIDQAPQPIKITVQVGQIINSTADTQQGRIVMSKNPNIDSSKRIINKRLTNHQASNNPYQIEAYGSINRYSSAQQRNSRYQVSTLSGKPATIGISTLLSLAPSVTYYGQRMGYIRLNNQLTIQATSGISVTPRILRDNRVQLTIRQVEAMLAADGVKHGLSENHSENHGDGVIGIGRVDTQQLATTLIVPFGQWVTIGEVSQSQQGFTTDNFGSRANNRTQTLPIQIKID